MLTFLVKQGMFLSYTFQFHINSLDLQKKKGDSLFSKPHLNPP